MNQNEPQLPAMSVTSRTERLVTATAIAIAAVTLVGCGSSGSDSSSSTAASIDSVSTVITTVPTPETTAPTTTSATPTTTPATPTTAATVPTDDAEAASATTAPDAPTIEETKVAIAAYRQCLTDNGVDPDQFDNLNTMGPPEMNQENIDAVMAALDACESLSTNIDITASMNTEQKDALNQWLIQIDTCAEGKGVQPPDPDAPLDELAEYDFEALTNAINECRDEIAFPDELSDYRDFYVQ